MKDRCFLITTMGLVFVCSLILSSVLIPTDTVAISTFNTMSSVYLPIIIHQPMSTATPTSASTITPLPATDTPSLTPTPTLTPMPTNTQTPTPTNIPISGLIDDFEDISDWYNLNDDLDQFDRCSDAIDGDYSFCIGGIHENYSWVGGTRKNLTSLQDWHNYNTLDVWIKRVDVPPRNGIPYLSIIISDAFGGYAYPHQDNDICLNWLGGGWRTPVENYGWQLFTLPLRQEMTESCFYPTDIDWAQVENVHIEVRTGLGFESPSDVYLDWMMITDTTNLVTE